MARRGRRRELLSLDDDVGVRGGVGRRGRDEVGGSSEERIKVVDHLQERKRKEGSRGQLELNFPFSSSPPLLDAPA